jgi:hypothetical protein
VNANDNIFQQNNFINNNSTVHDLRAYYQTLPFSPEPSPSFNIWDYSHKGNYWDNYEGTDSNNDGIGDSAYTVTQVGSNVDKYPLMAPVDITLETKLPTITFVSPQAKAYPVNNVPLNFTVNEQTLWTSYSLNGKTNVSISENVTLTELTDGTYSLNVYAMDIFGNIGISSINFTVDMISPNISFLSGENKTYTTTKVPVTIAVNETVSWMAYSLDGQANVTITGNTTLTGLTKGQHNLTLYAEDLAGNIGTSTTAFTVAEPWYSLTTLFVVSGVSVTIAVALLLYFKKRKSNSRNVEKAMSA